ncbi:hypothetical protein BDV98DRAFT_600443 [Pterulicium gracile]|uniref:F-box domain-containing protein n=1 Tax=Pterulicium gracile TaxID=1884261 RepID=A0A5C3R1C6_9AGAR|nr:hypothetical protein BDV98DRAFT_600443 [Pterula gracilis]
MIQNLPSELIAAIFAHLDVESIAKCSQVSQLFHDVTSTADLQYLILLEAQGQEDGPLKVASTLERTKALTEYASRWDKLDFAYEYTIPKSQGGLWELYGNVFAQNYASPARIEFHQLAAHSRGIEKESWTVKGLDFPVRDFGMDPAQDLLVLVEKPRWRRNGPVEEREFRFHIRDIRTGEAHSQTTLKPALVAIPQHKADPDASYSIQTCGDFFGVHVMHHSGLLSDELRIWNWKTGALHLQLTGEDMHSFAFLSDKHVIIAVIPSSPNEQSHLKVVAFTHPTEEPVDIARTDYLLSFDLPPMGHGAEMAEIHLRCDPSPVWRPNTPAPFFNAPENRVYIVTLWMHVNGALDSCSLAIPLSTLRAHLDDADRPKRLPWGVWGPHGSRLIHLPHGASTVWVCYVYGTRYVIPLVLNGQVVLEIYDFNQLATRKAAQEESMREFEEGEMEVCNDPSTSFLPVFAEPVITRLPYRKTQLPLPVPPTAMLLSEDSLIVVDRQDNQYVIKTI